MDSSIALSRLKASTQRPIFKKIEILMAIKMIFSLGGTINDII